MSAHVRHVSVLMAALVFHPAGPAAAQTQGDKVAVTTPDLSQARDGAWQRVGDGRPERDEPRSSSLLTSKRRQTSRSGAHGPTDSHERGAKARPQSVPAPFLAGVSWLWYNGE